MIGDRIGMGAVSGIEKERGGSEKTGKCRRGGQVEGGGRKKRVFGMMSKTASLHSLSSHIILTWNKRSQREQERTVGAKVGRVGWICRSKAKVPCRGKGRGLREPKGEASGPGDVKNSGEERGERKDNGVPQRGMVVLVGICIFQLSFLVLDQQIRSSVLAVTVGSFLAGWCDLAVGCSAVEVFRASVRNVAERLCGANRGWRISTRVQSESRAARAGGGLLSLPVFWSGSLSLSSCLRGMARTGMSCLQQVSEGSAGDQVRCPKLAAGDRSGSRLA